MYAVFVNGTYELICRGRRTAIREMFMVVKARMEHFKLAGNLTTAAIHADLKASHLHMAMMAFRNDVCNLGHEPDIIEFTEYFEVPEIQRFIERETQGV